MPAYDPAFTAASCFILRPGASGRSFWGFTLFLWLYLTAILYALKRVMSILNALKRSFFLVVIFLTFYENLKAICDEKNVSITNTVKICGGSTGSIGGWKAGKWPNSEIVFNLATRLDVSCDRLLRGEERNPALKISENGRIMLELFDQLSVLQQGIVIGHVQEMLSSWKHGGQEEKDQCVQKNKKDSHLLGESKGGNEVAGSSAERAV